MTNTIQGSREIRSHKKPNFETGNENPVSIGASSGIDATAWKLELYPQSAVNELESSYYQLASNSKCPNPFFEPGFAQPAIRHLGGNQIHYLCLTELSGKHKALKLFALARYRRVGLCGHRVLEVWSHPLAPLSTPLLCSNEYERVIDGFISCIENAPGDRVQAIHFPNLSKACIFSQTLHSEPRMSTLLFRHSSVARAAIFGREGLKTSTQNVSGKRKQRLRRAHERLSEFGSIEFNSFKDTDSVSVALQEHLQLEFNSWKGQRGTSILTDESATKFTNTAVENLSRKKQCTIHSLSLNGHPVSSMIMIHTNGYYYPWKIAYDENYSSYSVGNLLTAHVNETLLKERNFKALDSLASELNQTAKRFWPDQHEMTSIVIGLGRKGSQKAQQITAELEFLSVAKRRVKRWLGRSL